MPDLTATHLMDTAMRLVSSAENSSLDYEHQYAYIEDIKDGRGYTAGIIGFCSGTGDMLDVIQRYVELKPKDNILARYIEPLRKLDGSDKHTGLEGIQKRWKKASQDEAFRRAQDHIRDTQYFFPAVNQAQADGLQALGQFIYYDCIVMHGPGEESDVDCFQGIRKATMAQSLPPSMGGNEAQYLEAFLNARIVIMLKEDAHSDTSRIETAQRKFLREGNLGLDGDLTWAVYEEHFSLRREMGPPFRRIM